MKNVLKSLFLLILVLATSVFFLACVQPEPETTPESEVPSESVSESVSESDPEEPFDGESYFDVELPEVDRM